LQVQGLSFHGASMGRHHPNQIVSLGDDGALHVIDWREGHVKKIPLGDCKEVFHVHPAPGDRWLIAEHFGKSFLFDLSTEQPPTLLTGALRLFSPDQRWVVLGELNRLIVRELATGREHAVASPGLSVAAISHDGQTLALLRWGEAPKVLPEADRELGGILSAMGQWTGAVEFRSLPGGEL
jgi:hypothetical protein